MGVDIREKGGRLERRGGGGGGSRGDNEDGGWRPGRKEARDEDIKY